MSKIVFDDPAWWRRPGWQAIVAALLALAALVIWSTALAPLDHDPIIAPAPPAHTVMARTATPPAAPTVPVAPAAPAPTPAAVALPPLPSPRVAPQPLVPQWSAPGVPGVHVTPLNLPYGVLQVPPEQPTEENLEN